jgi:hypothetical protein
MFKNKIILLLLFPSVVWGDSSSVNLNLPSAPQTYASDRIRAGDLDCQNAIGSATNLEFGVVGIIDGAGYDPYTVDSGVPQMMGPQVDDVGVYARITIPIGKPQERINCNSLYKLELEKKRMEVMKLKQEVQNLKALQFKKED